MICSVAAFSSPDWLFLKEQHQIIWKVLGYSAVWIVVTASVILAISSCFTRKALALMCIFAIVFISDGVMRLGAEITGNENLGLFSLNQNFEAIGNWLFAEDFVLIEAARDLDEESGIGIVPDKTAWGIEASFWALGIMTLISWVVLWRNVKRMEVIA